MGNWPSCDRLDGRKETSGLTKLRSWKCLLQGDLPVAPGDIENMSKKAGILGNFAEKL